MPTLELISVIVINFNGKDFVDRFFRSLLKTNYKEFEVIFVDNASTDGSAEYVRNHFKDERIVMVRNNKNYGPSAARNIGFEKAKGEYIAFLDNDTEVDNEWINELVKVFENDPNIAVAQCKLLNMVERKKFDHAGDYLTPLGFLYERSRHCIDKGQFDKVEDILSAKSAATMIRSSVYRELGMYDDSYFIFLEETDFCFRAWLSGYRVVFVPRAVVWHAFNTPLKESKRYYSTYMIRFLGCRNYIMTLLKNLGCRNLLKILPVHIFSWICLSALFFFRGKLTDSVLILKGILWNLFHIKEILIKRTFVQQKLRKIDDKIFDKLIIRHSLWFYLREAWGYLRGPKY
ncbi:MAG: glycosyltransferase family 2 protein [Candidatus Omnitrophica bacterium]|nr:glycosyltransferase family 2 protein [Candidatus Omnitrophota bacterium]MDD5352446.1 glycosyltransferase family 2 protein [Candidatus Omnitrophota bacterium]MDD5550044.1 glycosyltransferase family 2 protein [Candidatus Omnitrophota bacterium]